MSHHENSAYLLDIQQAGLAIANFIKGMDETSFRADKKTQAVVQYQIMVTVHGQVSPTNSNNIKKTKQKRGLMQASESPSETCLSPFLRKKIARIPNNSTIDGP
jgi:hypothetical protein